MRKENVRLKNDPLDESELELAEFKKMKLLLISGLFRYEKYANIKKWLLSQYQLQGAVHGIYNHNTNSPGLLFFLLCNLHHANVMLIFIRWLLHF